MGSHRVDLSEDRRVPDTLQGRVKKIKVAGGKRFGATEMADRLASLERENRELR
jgi:hypothetical protein